MKSHCLPYRRRAGGWYGYRRQNEIHIAWGLAPAAPCAAQLYHQYLPNSSLSRCRVDDQALTGLVPHGVGYSPRGQLLLQDVCTHQRLSPDVCRGNKLMTPANGFGVAFPCLGLGTTVGNFMVGYRKHTVEG